MGAESGQELCVWGWAGLAHQTVSRLVPFRVPKETYAVPLAQHTVPFLLPSPQAPGQVTSPL